MKKHSSVLKSGKVSAKEAKPMRRESQQVMSELVAKLRKRLEGERIVEPDDPSAADWERPNLDRLTVGVNVGDQWSNYCILGLGGETLVEGQFRSQPEEVAGFFHGLAQSRVAMEVGTHSAWMREVIAELGHEVLVANARRMQGSKRRRRKNDRIDAARLARLGRIDPKSLYPIQHRSTEVREDLLVLRAREVLVESRTKLISAVDKEVFFSKGEVYSAYRKIKDILSQGRVEILVIDPYVDENLLYMCASLDASVNIRILTEHLKGDFKVGYRKLQQQRGKIEARTLSHFHD
jgi:hypothetical protein